MVPSRMFYFIFTVYILKYFILLNVLIVSVSSHMYRLGDGFQDSKIKTKGAGKSFSLSSRKKLNRQIDFF